MTRFGTEEHRVDIVLGKLRAGAGNAWSLWPQASLHLLRLMCSMLRWKDPGKAACLLRNQATPPTRSAPLRRQLRMPWRVFRQLRRLVPLKQTAPVRVKRRDLLSSTDNSSRMDRSTFCVANGWTKVGWPLLRVEALGILSILMWVGAMQSRVSVFRTDVFYACSSALR